MGAELDLAQQPAGRVLEVVVDEAYSLFVVITQHMKIGDNTVGGICLLQAPRNVEFPAFTQMTRLLVRGEPVMYWLGSTRVTHQQVKKVWYHPGAGIAPTKLL